MPGPHCATCLQEPLPLDTTVCAVDYEAPWDGLVQGLKYHEQLSAAHALGALLGRAVQQAGPIEPELVLLPVPLHPSRLLERGYNQSERIAQALSLMLQRPIGPAWVQRVTDTPPLALTHSREARRQSLKAAFALQPNAKVAGRHIALVDDVMTTGATMSALATLLRRHGAASVQAWVVARTPRPQD